MGEAVCAAGTAMLGAIAPGDRVSIIWDAGTSAITFNWDLSGWFWAAYDRKAQRLMGSGRAATIRAAVEQARDATQLQVLAAE